MKKRSFAIILVLVLLFSLVAGCADSGGAAETNEPASASPAADDTASGNEEAPVALTALFVKHTLTKDIETFKWLANIQDQANVTVEWTQYISGDEYTAVKAAMFAAGDVPDLLFNGTVSTDYAVYGGLFQELGQLIQDNGPNLTQMFANHPECKTAVTELDGKIWSTPKYQRVWPYTWGTMFINQDWLDNVGMEVPTTLGELYDVLKAFQEQDANGNGDPTDEIPMDYQSGYSASPLNFLGSYGIQLCSNTTNNFGFYAEDGTVKCFYLEDSYLDLVKYIRTLHEQGFVNPEALTQDYSQYQSIARGVDGVSKIGFTWGWESSDRFGPDLYTQYVPVPQLKLDEDSAFYTDDIRVAYRYDGLNYGANRVCMSAACENKEAAMKFIDTFYLPENSLQVLFGGIEDGCISKDGENAYTILDPLDSTIDPGTWKWTNAFADWGPTNIDESLEITLGWDMQGVTAEKSVYDSLVMNVATEDLLPITFMKFTDEQQTQIAFIGTAVTNLVNPSYAAWVTEGGVEDDIDGFRQGLIDAGINDLMAIYQESLDNYLATQS